MSDLTAQLSGFLEAVLASKKLTIGDVIHLINALIVLEQKIEKAIATEKDDRGRDPLDQRPDRPGAKN